jgi:hypothetical protein
MASLHSIKISGSWCPRCRNKHESLCGEALAELLPEHKFFSTRALEWLKLGRGGYPLELDFYCEELRLAVEYSGRQHYELIDHFHTSQADFERGLERDRLKADACDDNWVTLIVVPYTVATHLKTPEKKRAALLKFLRAELTELGYLPEAN